MWATGLAHLIQPAPLGQESSSRLSVDPWSMGFSGTDPWSSLGSAYHNSPSTPCPSVLMGKELNHRMAELSTEENRSVLKTNRTVLISNPYIKPDCQALKSFYHTRPLGPQFLLIIPDCKVLNFFEERVAPSRPPPPSCPSTLAHFSIS